MSKQPINDESCEELLRVWGTHAPGELPRDLKGRVRERMTARPTSRHQSTFALAACLLVCLCITALWWGREIPPVGKLAADPPSPPTAPASLAAVQEQIASLGAELRRTELISRIEKQEAELRELQQLLTEQRMELDRAQVRKQVVSEWLANNHQQ
jgi:uncharacterized coiled-coil protein SlyX